MSDAGKHGQAKYVGRSMPRKEDGPLLRGQGRFAADIKFPDQLHMRVVRSTFAHGKIVVGRPRAGAGDARRARRLDVLPTSPTFRRSISG